MCKKNHSWLARYTGMFFFFFFFFFTDVLHPYSSLPIHVRYLYLFATNVFATCTLSLPVIFATWHNISHQDSGKDIGIILKLNGGDMTHILPTSVFSVLVNSLVREICLFLS